MKIVEYLDGLKDLKGPDVTGFTLSSQAEAIFWGHWWSEPEQRTIEDRIVLVIVDYLARSEGRSAYSLAREIKDSIAAIYKQHTLIEEEEFWVVAHPVDRLI